LLRSGSGGDAKAHIKPTAAGATDFRRFDKPWFETGPEAAITSIFKAVHYCESNILI